MTHQQRRLSALFRRRCSVQYLPDLHLREDASAPSQQPKTRILCNAPFVNDAAHMTKLVGIMRRTRSNNPKAPVSKSTPLSTATADYCKAPMSRAKWSGISTGTGHAPHTHMWYRTLEALQSQLDQIPTTRWVSAATLRDCRIIARHIACARLRQ